MNSNPTSSPKNAVASSGALADGSEDKNFAILREVIDVALAHRSSDSILWGAWIDSGSAFAEVATPLDWQRLAHGALQQQNTTLLSRMAACAGLDSVLAGLDETTKSHEPLLCLAVRNPDDSGVAALLKLGCDPKAKNAEGETALIIVSGTMGGWRAAATECAKILAPVSDVNAKAPDGKNALMTAVQAQNMDLIKILASISDVRAQDQAGRSALHFAANRNAKITAFLAGRVDASLRDAEGKTALERAIDGAAWDSADALMARLPAREATAMLRKITEKLFPSTLPHVEAVALEDAVGLGDASKDEFSAKEDEKTSRPKTAPKSRRM